MNKSGLKSLDAYKKLKKISDSSSLEELNLKKLFNHENRFENFCLKKDGFLFDFSKQRINQPVFNELINLAKQSNAKKSYEDMLSGKKINSTEKRAALHTWTRNFSTENLVIDNVDISRELKTVNQEIKSFTQNIHEQKITNAQGLPFTDAVIVGIGGSYLGCEFAYIALKAACNPKINLHFLPNVDIDNFGQVIRRIPPEQTLWIVISKSYTTTETMANLEQVRLFFNLHHLESQNHLITITAKGSPGDDPSNPVLSCFHMFDFIGGRYSVSSAVGGLPLSLAFGYDVFERFLKGCGLMDCHAAGEPEHRNIPLVAALINIWNSNFLKLNAQAIIPYSCALSKLAPHVQQLYMESLGKRVTQNGETIDYPTGVIIFGEPGTNAQHSFFQLAHQGQAFPIDFIGIVNPVYQDKQALSNGVYNHQELWANMLAQAKALAIGREDEDNARVCPGNRPSSTILLNDLTPESIGQLLAFYEARTVFEGFILGLNPFDQFGVEVGKKLATDLRKQIALKNKDAEHVFDTDPASKWYLDSLFKGGL